MEVAEIRSCVLFVEWFTLGLVLVSQSCHLEDRPSCICSSCRQGHWNGM
jgi:hypothetical protein